MKRWLVIFTGAGAVAAVCGAAYWGGGAPVQAARAVRERIEEYVDEQAKTRLPRVYLITMPQAGRVEAITLEEGAAVREGQVVARIVADDAELPEAAARAAVARLDAAIAENDDLALENRLKQQAEQFVASMTATVQAAEARLGAGQARMEYAETFLQRIRDLAARNAETQDELDRAELQYVESQAEYRQDALVLEALRAVQAATNLLPAMVGDLIARKRLRRTVLEREREQAEAQWRRLEAQRRRAVLRSPVDGVVLRREVSNERFLGAGDPLLAIGRLEDLEVEADFLTEDAVRLRPGQPAALYGPALGAAPQRGLPARVHRIDPAGFTKISSLGVEQQRVRVIFRFDRDVLRTLRERNVGVGYRVRVRVTTAAKADALTIPRSALFRDDQGGWRVLAIRGGRTASQPVRVGLMNDERAEVLEGLEEGELVVAAPENDLAEGQRVAVQQAGPPERH